MRKYRNIVLLVIVMRAHLLLSVICRSCADHVIQVSDTEIYFFCFEFTFLTLFGIVIVLLENHLARLAVPLNVAASKRVVTHAHRAGAAGRLAGTKRGNHFFA